MEADVALHTSEKWASGSDSRSDKIKYVYSNRRKEREAKSARKASRLQQIKPSRSYDNEIESSVKEQDLGQPLPVPKTKDDSSMRYGEQPISRHQPEQTISRSQPRSGIPTPTSSPYASRKNIPVLSPGGTPEMRWKRMDRRERSKISTASQSPRMVASETQIRSRSQVQHPKKLKDEKVPVKSNRSIPTPHGIVLEVKDGPSIRYKPSETMLSDATEIESYSQGRSVSTAVDAKSLDNPITASPQFHPCRWDVGSGNVHPGFEHGAKSTRDRSIHELDAVYESDQSSPGHSAASSSQQPRSKHKDLSLNDDPVLKDLPKSECGALSSDYAMSPCVQSDAASLTDHSEPDPGATSKHPRDDDVGNQTDLPSISSQNANLDPMEPDSLVFQNAFETSQKKHGIKHDDIVVGPAASLRQFNPSPHISDETAFSSISLMSQLKAGICHDDIVVGPNAKKQKDPSHLSTKAQCNIPSGLSSIPKTDIGDCNNIVIPAKDTIEPDLYPEQESKCVVSQKTFIGGSLERESRIPKRADAKVRGGSPGFRIPVRSFRNRSVDNALDKIRGVSPTVSEEQCTRSPASIDDSPDSGRGVSAALFNKQRVRSPVSEDSSCGVSPAVSEGQRVLSPVSVDRQVDSSYGSVDRLKWRPKPGKSGLHRMKRGAKREANVSTESGYATDQMPSGDANESKLSPSSDSRERFQRIGGSCSNIDKDLEELVLDSKQISIECADTKKQSIKTEGTIQLPNGDESRGTSKLRNIEGDGGFIAPIVKSQGDEFLGKTSAVIYSNRPPPQPSSPIVEGPSASLEHRPSLPSEGPISEVESSKSPEQCLNGHRQQPPQLLQTSPVPHNQSTTVPSNPISSPSVPIKPRFHRSAEHLVSSTQLSVFHSTDNVQQPVDITTTAPSTKISTQSVQESSYTHRSKSSGTHVDVVATPKRSDKPVKGRSVSLLRRESDRSVTIVRRGSDRAIPVSRHDPSVHDLKAANSLKELCQSMASLLNIDNEKAAEMLSTSLSKRRDLVEGLDADAILDYLTHHGVLDPSVLVNLEGQGDGEPVTSIQRNSAILKHVEEHGDTAVALFINALRQSGQLHLASSLDTEQRIKPMSGQGYLDKPRHKGEIVVRLSIEALKILAPRDPPSEKNVNMSLLSSPSRERNLDFVDSDEDQVKPRSCWCFCVSRKRTRSSSSRKGRRKQKNVTNGDNAMASTQYSPQMIDPANPYRSSSVGNNTQSKSSTFVSSSSNRQSSSVPASSQQRGKEKKKKGKLKSSGKPIVPGSTETTAPDVSHPRIPQNLNLDDGVIMEYDPHLELVKLRACHDELASPTRQAGPVGIMVEQWKSSGKHFLVKSDLLCRAIVDEFLTDIIKYFEQDRGTLVLDVVSEATSVTVFNICMTKNQVTKLEKDHIDGSLLEQLQDVFMARLDISKFDIRGVRFLTEVDGNQLRSVLSELS